MRKKIKSVILMATCFMLCGAVINYNTEIKAYGKMFEDFESERCGAYNGFLYEFLNPEKTEVGLGAFSGEYYGMIDYPREIKGAKVISIMYGFNPNGVTEINITDNITLIEPNAFKWCKIESLLIPKTVKYIREYAFDCPTLKKVTIFKESKLENRAFSRANPDLIVYGEAGSDTEREAKFAGLKFIPIDADGKEVPKTIADNELVIPKSVEKLDGTVILPTSKLSKITVYKDTDVNINAFDNSSKDIIVYGEIGSSAEKAAKKWFNPRTFIPINENGEVIDYPVIAPATTTVQTPTTTPEKENITPPEERRNEDGLIIPTPPPGWEEGYNTNTKPVTETPSSTPKKDKITSISTNVSTTGDTKSILMEVLLFGILGAFGLVSTKKRKI